MGVGLVCTNVALASGWDDVGVIPDEISFSAPLCRTAVIQDSLRPDKVDMYFDEALFRALLAFVAEVEPGVDILVAPELKQPAIRLASFLEGWQPDDDDPPGLVVARRDGRDVLYIVTEYWTRFGGPMPYHDSYTYSIWHADDLARRAMAFLMGASDADQWRIAPDILAVGDPEPLSARPEKRGGLLGLLRRLFG